MNIRDIDLNLLVIFEAVYTLKNISKAADYLGMSQPALSNAMARLRSQLDDQLFVRTGNGVAPTIRADGLIEPVRLALQLLGESLSGPNSFDPDASAKVFKLVIADPMEPIVLPPIVRAVQQRKAIHFELLPPQSIVIEDALKNTTADIAIFPKIQRDPELTSVPLCPIDSVLLMRKGHPGQGMAFGELMKSFGHASLDLRAKVLANSSAISLPSQPMRTDVCLVNRVSSAVQLVAHTDLLCFAPRLYAQKMASIVNLEIINPPVPVSDQQFHMIWHKRMETDSAHLWLRQMVQDAMSEALKS